MVSGGGVFIQFSASMYYDGAVYWSRRIIGEYRVIYKVQEKALRIALFWCYD